MSARDTWVPCAVRGLYFLQDWLYLRTTPPNIDHHNNTEEAGLNRSSIGRDTLIAVGHGGCSLWPQCIHLDRVQSQSLGEASLQLSFDNMQTSFSEQVSKLLI
jgi:hypothetical protein